MDSARVRLPLRTPPVLLTEGYRLFFPWAALLGFVGILPWAAAFAGWSPLPFATADHAALMLLGAWGAAILGFVFTAFPRQNEAPMPGPRLVVATLVAHILAVAALLPFGGLPSPLRAVLAAGPWLVALGWALPIARRSLARRHDGTTLLVPVALAAAVAASVSLAAGFSPLGLRLGTHGFALLAALAVLDRILPFFCFRAIPGYVGRRLAGFAPALLAATALRVAVPEHPWLGDLALFGVVARQWWGWRPLAGLAPMIAAIHLGILWTLAGYALDAADVGPASLGPHLWLVGGMGSFWAALSMRVMRGHAGLAVTMGIDGALIVGLVQVAALGRVLGALTDLGAAAFATAGFALAAAFGLWLWRIAPLATRTGQASA